MLHVCFQWAFKTANTNRQKVADRVTEIADEWQKEIKESLRNTFVTVSNKHHFYYMLWSGNDVIFWRSEVLDNQTSNTIFQSLSAVLNELLEADLKVNVSNCCLK